MSKCCGGLVVTGGDFGSIGHRFESWWWQSNFSLYIGDWNSSVKWREYFGSYLFAAKIPGTLAGNKTRNVSSNCRWEPAHNAIWPKFFRKLKTVWDQDEENPNSHTVIRIRLRESWSVKQILYAKPNHLFRNCYSTHCPKSILGPSVFPWNLK